jgi:two-component system LytT family sensor kinase
VGLLFTLSWYIPAKAEGRPIPFASAATWYLTDSYLWFALCPFIFLFYRRFPLDAARIHCYALHFLVAVVISCLHFSALLGLDKLIDPAFAVRFPTFRDAMTQLLLFRIVSGTVTYALMLAVFSARDYYAGLRTEREYRALLEHQAARAELTALKMQLHPHFLFNTLHSVSALIDEQPREAIRMIARLGEFLRVTLESSETQLICLEEEVRFVELYFEIEQVRIGDRVRLLVQIDPRTRLVLVPNLILQPLIENALRHGAWQQVHHARVIVSSRVLGDSVEIIVRNELQNALGDRAYEPPNDHRESIREGVGLSNVRSRLQQLYPSRFRFEYGWISPGFFQVSLVLPATSGHATP